MMPILKEVNGCGALVVSRIVYGPRLLLVNMECSTIDPISLPIRMVVVVRK